MFVCYRTEAVNIVIHTSNCGRLAECCVLVSHAHHWLGRICPWPHRSHLHHQLEKQWCVSEDTSLLSVLSLCKAFSFRLWILKVERGLQAELILFDFRSFVSYTMTVITVNFIIPLSVMFYCYYNVSVTVKRFKVSNCLDSIDMDWSDQMDVTKASKFYLIFLIFP